MTGRELITAALRKLGANSANAVPTAEDMDVSLEALNILIDSKSNTLLNIHTITPFLFSLVAGQYIYTLGPTGDWVVERPMRVEKLKLVLGSGEGTLFLPIDLVPDEEYANIRMRGVTNSMVQIALDNGGFPNRSIYLWPIPTDSTKSIEAWLWSPLQIVDLDVELDLPPGYERYLIYALALELCDEFGKQPSGEVLQSLMEAESMLKSLNQITFVMQASQAAKDLSTGGDIYNIIDFYAGSWMLPRKAT